MFSFCFKVADQRSRILSMFPCFLQSSTWKVGFLGCPAGSVSNDRSKVGKYFTPFKQLSIKGIYLLIYVRIYYSFIYLFIHSFIHLFIYSFISIYLFIYWVPINNLWNLQPNSWALESNLLPIVPKYQVSGHLSRGWQFFLSVPSQYHQNRGQNPASFKRGPP